jgi:hypothetical protein
MNIQLPLDAEATDENQANCSGEALDAFIITTVTDLERKIGHNGY